MCSASFELKDAERSINSTEDRRSPKKHYEDQNTSVLWMQCAMKEDDIPKTAFRAGSGGPFEFTRMLYGICNAPARY